MRYCVTESYVRHLASKAKNLLWGSEATAACGGRREPSEWPRSTDAKGLRRRRQMSGTATGGEAKDAAYFESCHPDHAKKNRQGKARSDMPWVETAEDQEFTRFVKDFPSESRPRILELLQKYENKNIYIFTDRTQADQFLQHNF